MKLALNILAGLFFWACIAASLLTIVIGQPFLDCITQLAWRLK